MTKPFTKEELERHKAIAAAGSGRITSELVVRLIESAERELELREIAMLGMSFAPKGPVTKDVFPTSYFTLNYEDEVKLQSRIDAARETLTKLYGETK